MDKTVILLKIEALKRCINRIKSKRPECKENLYSDLDTQDIIVLNLERAVQMSVDIAAHIVAELGLPTPVSMFECFDRLMDANIISSGTADRMQKSVGFRNLAVHQYESIDWDIVYSIITTHLDDFRNFAREIIQWMDNQLQ